MCFQNELYATSASGIPRIDISTSLSVGPRGPILLQDVNLLEELAHFDRERIPERVVHAKGAGAFGYFQVTNDITKYSAATVFQSIGKKTNVALRFSTVGGELGSADTVRDPRGFALKFYTEEGNWDLVGNNTPIFFIRDPILFPHFIHTQKRNPVTHLKDANMFWDFLSLRPETIHQTLFLFTDRGIPDGYRHMNGYGSHTYKLVNDNGKFHYCKFHFKTDQGIKNLSVEEANKLSSTDPDYSIRDLYNAIENKNYPTWSAYIQVMTPEQASSVPFNPFDLTKVWSQTEFPLIPVGKLVLDRNPKNYFAEVEQLAFCPANLVPGIEPSPDKMLQGRLFAYNDTQRHRLGPNFQQLPVNCPFSVRNYQRDGLATVIEPSTGPNYHPNSFDGPTHHPRARALTHTYSLSGEVRRYDIEDGDDYIQAKVFYQKVLSPSERERLISNIVGHLKDAASFIQTRTVKNFSRVDATLGEKITNGLKLSQRAQSSL